MGKDQTNSFQKFVKEEAEKSKEIYIPILLGVDAVHGNALCPGATIFPSQLSLACSWNPILVEQVAEVTAKECRAAGIHWTYSPVCDIARDLRWGRINETYGEDPYLSSILVKATVTGYEGLHRPDKHSRILSCAKHFAGYSQTVGGRDATEAELSKRNLEMTYFPSFRSAIEAHCSTIMTAYMAIDGIPASLNRWLLTETLRDKWGFKGFVVTDYNNIGRVVTEQFVRKDLKESTIDSVIAGNDMMMGTPRFYDNAIEAVKSGQLSIDLIHTSVRRILKAKSSLGLLDDPFTGDWSQGIIGCPQHYKIALESAKESLVLLKNHNSILPLQSPLKKIALIGPNADAPIDMLGDWTAGCRWTPGNATFDRSTIKTVYDALKEYTTDKLITLDYTPGCDILDTQLKKENLEIVLQIVKQSDVAILVLGDPMVWNGEKRDRANLDLPEAQQSLLRAVYETGTPVILVLICGKPNCIPWAAEHIPAILLAFNPGMLGGSAIVSALFGAHNPSGRLCISWPRHVGQLPVFYNQIPGWHTNQYIDMTADPQWAFGYGLSYAHFSMELLEMDKNELRKGEEITLSVGVVNTSGRDGKETIQVYLRQACATVTLPLKRLIAFQKIEVLAGEKKKLSFKIPYNALSIINSNLQEVVETGVYTLMIGPNSQDLRALSFTVL